MRIQNIAGLKTDNWAYLGIDPGGKDTGIAACDKYGKLIKYAVVPNGFEGFQELLVRLTPESLKFVSIEEYIQDPNIGRGGSKLEEIQVIGAAKTWCALNKVKIYEEERRYKPIAYIRAGLPTKLGKPNPPNKLTSHWMDAYAYIHRRMLYEGIIDLQITPIRKTPI